MDVADVARGIAAARCLVGVALLVAPRRATSVWLGEHEGPSVRIAAQALGARDVALGAGMLVALSGSRTAEARRWLTAGVVGDVTDLVATAFSSRPWAQRAAVAGPAAAATATGLLLRSRLR